MGLSGSILQVYGELILSTNVTPSAAQNSFSTGLAWSQFTLPSAGTWEIHYCIRGFCTTSSNVQASLSVAIQDNFSLVLPDSELLIVNGNNVHSQTMVISGSAYSFVRSTIPLPAIYTLKVWNYSSNANATAVSDASGKSWVKWKLVG